jgi:F-type H+-transporting ATPase subunit b
LIHFYKRDSTKYIMLSRVALSRGAQAQQVLVRGLSVSAPNMERDLVNYPARVRPIEKAPVRCLVFPEEWFTACYSKTGVTGPYMFLVGVGTFLASKEFFVMEHDFYVGLGLAAVLTLVVKQVGPDWTAEVNKDLDEEEAQLKAIRQNEIDAIKNTIALEKEAQLDAAAYTDIITAKKEAVGLQLEAGYRARLVEAHSAVKKRLDYQLETANVMRRMEQKHMVDWIISNVKKSITPAQEDAALKKCIADLKKLSAA